MGATKITCFGMDFTYPDAHDAEKGRACVEFWLGVAPRAGSSSRCRRHDAHGRIYPRAGVERFYGYDCVELAVKRNEAGHIVVSFTERAALPTADEIEARYDHTVHPNPLVPRKRKRERASSSSRRRPPSRSRRGGEAVLPDRRHERRAGAGRGHRGARSAPAPATSTTARTATSRPS
jgi:hypothetical protein